MSTEYNLDTPFGKLTVLLTSGVHACVSTPTREPITVNGIPYQVNFHFRKYPSGWYFDVGTSEGLDPIANDSGNPAVYSSMTRTDRLSSSSDVSPAAYKKFSSVLLTVVQAWVQVNQAAILEAAQMRRREIIARKREQILEHEMAITKLRAEVIALSEKTLGGSEDV